MHRKKNAADTWECVFVQKVISKMAAAIQHIYIIRHYNPFEIHSRFLRFLKDSGNFC